MRIYSYLCETIYPTRILFEKTFESWDFLTKFFNIKILITPAGTTSA